MTRGKAGLLSLGSGLTNPCPIDVDMEPFSASVNEVLSRLFATTTKICADGGSRPAHARSLRRAPPRPSYSPGLGKARGPLLPRRPSIGRTL